jgi:hypothetical protein
MGLKIIGDVGSSGELIRVCVCVCVYTWGERESGVKNNDRREDTTKAIAERG